MTFGQFDPSASIEEDNELLANVFRFDPNEARDVLVAGTTTVREMIMTNPEARRYMRTLLRIEDSAMERKFRTWTTAGE